MTDWFHLDLSEGSSDLDLEIVDSLSISSLMLSIQCNLEVIDDRSVQQLFDETLDRIVEDAREVFAANRKEIVRASNKERRS